ncbi:Mitochondrial outer membrane protein [Venturia nashicola]|uniref:Mitochondrial outer membrane protein n=1 Tax=Venturia nashicola TaxID=86259 RepID=A0A4Z1PHM5_9PEZI|nr:Mitochondrial outer membrane protein [Venturia nashicola]
MWSSALKSFSSNIHSLYKVSDTPSSTSGTWAIYDAKHKTSGKLASVFVFDKKSLENGGGGGLGGRSNAASLKRAHEEVVERLKREASSLARLRHPSILELVEPVEVTRSGGLTFATEPVTASLAGLLREKDEQERAGGVGGRSSRYVVDDQDGRGKRRREIEIDELEIQKGLLQVGKGLEFMHESAGLVHGNLTPDAIFVNAKGDWKISGLGFSGKSETFTGATSAQPIALSEILNFDPRLPRFVQLDLDYSSPDFVMDGNASAAADMFSLGILIIALYNSPHKSPLETNMSVSTYKRIFSSSASVPTSSNNFLSSVALARPVNVLLSRLITRRPAQRLNARGFLQADYFDNILVSTIRFLESLPEKTPNEKSQFLRGLPRIINQFPKTVLEKKILPALLDEMKDKELIALILQNVFKMLKLMPSGKRAFTERVSPRLREIFLTPSATKKDAAPERDSAKEAGLVIILENMDIISGNTNGKEFKDDIWPIIQLSMESPTHSLVDASLGTLSVILSVLDFSTIKNEVFPVIAAVFTKTSSLGIKIRGLEALQVLCGGAPGPDGTAGDGLDGLDQSDKNKKKPQSAILDKYTIQEKVVPLLKGIKTKEPAVMMAALDVFKEVGKIADADFLAMDALPILWAFSLGPLLNLQQFQSFMTLIKSLSVRIEQEQTRKLQEMGSTTSASANRADLMSGMSANRVNGLDSTNGDEGDFESLVLGRQKPQSDSSDPWASASRPAAARTSSGRMSSPSATFSWSTPPPQSMPNTLAPNGAASRAITPDHSLSSFAALQPASSTMTPSFSQPLQPSRSMAPTSSNPSTFPQQAGRAVDWSAAGNSNWSAKPTMNPAPSTTSNPWASSPMSTPSYGQPMQPTQPTAFSIAPPPSSPYSTFSIAPPPAGGVSRQPSYNTAPAQQQILQQPGQKQGMDKYESLL